MNRKLFMVLAILLVGIVGIAMAEEAEQEIDAKLGPFTATITAPIDVPEWVLERGIDNDLYVGDVEISTNAPSAWDMKLTVTGDYTDWVFDTPLKVKDSTDTWVELVSGTLLESTKATSTPVVVPINIRQTVSSEPAVDPAGDKTLTLTYTVSVIPPEP